MHSAVPRGCEPGLWHRRRVSALAGPFLGLDVHHHGYDDDDDYGDDYGYGRSYYRRRRYNYNHDRYDDEEEDYHDDDDEFWFRSGDEIERSMSVVGLTDLDGDTVLAMDRVIRVDGTNAVLISEDAFRGMKPDREEHFYTGNVSQPLLHLCLSTLTRKPL